MPSYYLSEDLSRFGDMGRTVPQQHDLFMKWYGKVMEKGALDERTKKLIALAVAYAIQEPYCIDSYSSACAEAGITPDRQWNALGEIASAVLDRFTLVLGDRPVSHVLGAHIELDANGELFRSGSQHHPNERALALTKADVLGLPQALADFNGFYSTHANYVITNPKRNLLVVAIGAVLLLVALVWGWRRMRKPKQS